MTLNNIQNATLLASVLAKHISFQSLSMFDSRMSDIEDSIISKYSLNEKIGKTEVSNLLKDAYLELRDNMIDESNEMVGYEFDIQKGLSDEYE